MSNQDHLHDPALLERWFEVLAKTVAVDFDGVLHPYTDGWVGSTPADEMTNVGAAEFLRELKAQGYRVVVFSCRCDHPEGLIGTRDWLERFDLMQYIDDITHLKPAAIAYVDDRAVTFRWGEWGRCLEEIQQLGSGGPRGTTR